MDKTYHGQNVLHLFWRALHVLYRFAGCLHWLLCARILIQSQRPRALIKSLRLDISKSPELPLHRKGPQFRDRAVPPKRKRKDGWRAQLNRLECKVRGDTHHNHPGMIAHIWSSSNRRPRAVSRLPGRGARSHFGITFRKSENYKRRSGDHPPPVRQKNHSARHKHDRVETRTCTDRREGAPIRSSHLFLAHVQQTN